MRDRTLQGLDLKPYIEGLDRKMFGYKITMALAGLLTLAFVGISLFYSYMLSYLMLGLGLIMLLGSAYIYFGYTQLTQPNEPYERIDLKITQKDLKTKEFKAWLEKHKFQTLKKGKHTYIHHWYAFAYVPIHFVIKPEKDHSKVYYLWPRQSLVVSPDHPNLTKTLGPYKVRERELNQDMKALKELGKVLDKN